MFRIKICGVTSVKDARAAADAGADAIGLNFFKKSRRFVEPLVAREIVLGVPAGVTKVGVFVNHQHDEIEQIVNQVGLDAVQLHGDEPPRLLLQLPAGATIVCAFRCGREGLAPFATYLNECQSLGRSPDAVLVDSDAAADFGGSGLVADWALIAEQRAVLGGTRVILAGGLSPENVADAIAAVQPDAVDVASGVESTPGRKNAALVRQFVAAARLAFRRHG